MQGTAEEQFAAIAAAARAEVLNDIDDILTDDESVDYSLPKQQPLEPQVQVQNNNQQISDSDETNNCTPESATDSSLDTSSIEVIQPHEGLEIRLPINPPQRAPPNSPESPRTNIAVPVPDDLLTEDEETGDDNVPPTETTVKPDVKGRQETLSPTPQVSQMVWSAIELAVKDFEPSEQRIIDKCGEVDFQLSNHETGNNQTHDYAKKYAICYRYYINQGLILKVFQLLKTTCIKLSVCYRVIIAFSLRLCF